MSEQSESEALEVGPKVLLIDDDAELRALVAAHLASQGFAVQTAESARAASGALARGGFDIVLLDLNLGDGDGLELCRTLRQTSQTPVIMLTARADPIDRILGIEIGADDYLTKPFHPRELVARMRSVLRRAQGAPAGPAGAQARAVGFAGWRLDFTRRELRRPDGALLHLGDAEFDLLVLLVERAQRIVSRDELFSALHGRTPDPEDRSLDLRLSRLRRKMEVDPKHPTLIKTVRTEGFLFTEPTTPA